MLTRLQRKTLSTAHLAGYAATLLVGVLIVVLACQLYGDLRPVLTHQTDVFRHHAVTLSKNVSLLQSLNKRGIYFSDKEIERLREQRFVRDVARFSSSTFEVEASIDIAGQGLRTDLFFESIPDRYVDVESAQWRWDPNAGFIPIIIPEDYLNLYNFGFAESQSLPVVSQGTLSAIAFDITLSGNGLRQRFDSRIVGYSGKINTILVPEAFLQWANRTFGSGHSGGTSRLLVELADASDEALPAFIEAHNYNIKRDELESSKMVFFFHLALVFLLAVAAVIIVLSVAFILLSLNLVVQKHRELFVNLYNIGYTPRRIARFYQRRVSVVTVAVVAVATVVAVVIRKMYVGKLSTVFQIEGTEWPIVVAAVVLAAVLVVAYHRLVLRTVRRTVEPKKYTD